MELHPEDFNRLHNLFEGDFQVRATELDGWLALGAHLPPKEKRGLVLVDPPFEEEGEYEAAGGRAVDRMAPVHRAAPTASGIRSRRARRSGIFTSRRLWKSRRCFAPNCRCAKRSRYHRGSSGSGLVIVNPPFTLKGELDILLPYLKTQLAQDRFASGRCFWLRGEAPLNRGP
jgi:23S rRNA (adenine2030-N6)-methyltransferase